MNNDFNYNGGYQHQNPFTNEPQYDFYDELVVEDSKKTVSRSMLSLVFYTLVTSALVYGAAYALLFIVDYFMGDYELYMKIAGSSLFSFIVGSVAQYGVAIPVAFLVVRKLPKKPVPLAKPKMSIRHLLMMIPIAQMLMVIGSLIGQFVSSVYSSLLGTGNNNAVDNLLDSTPLYLVMIFVVVIGPIFEELLFRKLLLDRLSVYGNKLAIIITAVAFGLWHGNLDQLFYTTLVGLVLGYVAVKSGKWQYSAIVHMVLNFVGGFMPTLVSPYIERYEEIYNLVLTDPVAAASLPIADMLIFYLMALYSSLSSMLFIGGIVLLALGITKRWFTVEERLTVRIPKRRVAGVIFKNPGSIIFLVLSGILIISDILKPLIDKYADQIMQTFGG